MQTLVIVSHPYPDQSIITKALQDTALKTANVTVRNLESLYGNDVTGFDVAAEQAASEAADRIVFLYPTHWFNLTPMIKAYLNEVWSYGWAFGPEGTALKGKEMLVVTCAGASKEMYSLSGLIETTMDEVLSPMKACALYVGMQFIEPLVFNSVMGATEEMITEYQKAFASKLEV